VSDSPRIHIIACGVLRIDLEEAIRELGLQVSFQYLPGGLHSRPHELHRRLQEAIDETSAVSTVDRIAVGYGVCGLGSVDIHSRDIPLLIPRVHDCIALFLGSDTAYKREFARYPGTYYVSAGWVEGKSQAPSSGAADSQSGDDRPLVGGGPTQEEFRRFVKEYGEENAEAIKRFLNSWQSNYQRAAFIDTGARRRERYADIARAMAAEFGWKYENLPGSRAMLVKLLTAKETNDEILVIPPHHVTIFDPTGRKLKAVPVWEKGKAEERHSFTMTVGRTPDTVPSESSGSRATYGLGIDAGGTYTDVVIHDFSNRPHLGRPRGASPDHLVEKAKALTTKWDYTIGIDEALDNLDPKNLSSVNLVSVSTTLATNAIVEGRGQEVGLLVMPPFGWKELENFKHSPIAIIDGQVAINGQEKVPVNPAQVSRVVREMIETHKVKAFAVAGYAGHVNPSHELLVKRIIRDETGYPATCGHDVSEGLNYRVRAETAALNARIIPYLDSLFQKVQESLERRGIHAPVMVVKSDGSLTSLQTARERPIETILSGPAASVAGARVLTGCTDAIVIDIGGTTSDTAVIENGIVKIRERGAVVGGWQTHVKALDMRTLGLGGDSLITWKEGEITIGPQRVAPVSWLISRRPEGMKAIQWIERHLSAGEVSSRSLELIALNGYDESWRLDTRESQIVEALRGGPRSVQQLSRITDSVAWQLLPLRGLEDRHIIQRCGLTPTDLLHVLGRVDLWDGRAARRMCEVFGKLQRMDAAAFAKEVIGRVHRLLAKELLKKRLDNVVEMVDLDGSPLAQTLIDLALQDGNAGNEEQENAPQEQENAPQEPEKTQKQSEGFEVTLKLGSPVVGIGAPTHQFLPYTAKLLHTEAIVPPHADVANAIGAITSSVYVHRKVTISVDEKGIFHLKGLPEAPTFGSLDSAQEYAIEQLRGIVQEMAKKAGTSQTSIEIVVDDDIGSVSDGSGIFLGRTLEARVSGQPDLVLLE